MKYQKESETIVSQICIKYIILVQNICKVQKAYYQF